MEPDRASEPIPPTSRQESIAATQATLAWLKDLSLSVLIAVLVILFLYQPVKVEGTSMMPALVDQERIFINKYLYRFHLAEVGRGDTVVFWFPGDISKSYIKRIIGVPGDRVEVREGDVWVNGNRIEEPYVPEEYRDKTSTAAQVIPPDRFFVMGDHRSSSNDSRTWGMVPRNLIYGKAIFVYWPLERMGLLH
jgi:signal peptidase I